MGAHLNAYTSREMTAYYARTTGPKMPQCVEIIGDILMNSTLDPNAIARERDVILREAQEVCTLLRSSDPDLLHDNRTREPQPLLHPLPLLNLVHPWIWPLQPLHDAMQQ